MFRLGVVRCFTFGYTSFVRWVDWGAVSLGFPTGFFKSHSLRRGGAAHLTLTGHSLHYMMAHGRWASERTAKLYVSKGEVALTRLRHSVDDGRWARILQLAQSADQVLFS